MNYYQFNVNDYLSDTAHLDLMEDLAYRRLIDLYYQTEAALVNDIQVLAKRIRMRGYEEAILAVLDEFFILSDDGFHHTRCDEQLAEIYKKSESARQSAQKRWAKNQAKAQSKKQPERVVQTEPEILPEVCEINTSIMQEKSEANALQMQHSCDFDANALQTHCDGNATQYPIPSITTTATTRANNFDDRVKVETEPFAQTERFTMHANWQPENVEFVNNMLRRICLPSCDTDLIQAAMMDFVAYWSAKPNEFRTAQEWDSAFVQSAQKFRVKYGHDYDASGSLKVAQSIRKGVQPLAQGGKPYTPNGVTPAVQPLSATAKSATCLKAAKAALQDGRAQPLTTVPVLAAVVDGLLDLLGCGLKYPPAADAWDITLQSWDKAFSVLNLTADDVPRVFEAFANVKRNAQSVNGTGEFPRVHEVIGALPMKFVPRIEVTETPEQRAARKEAGAKHSGALLASLGKHPSHREIVH